MEAEEDPEFADMARPIPCPPRRSGQLMSAFVASLIINGAFLLFLLFVVISRPIPPIHFVNVIAAPQAENEPKIIGTELARYKPAPHSGGASMAAIVPVLSSAISQVSLTPPEMVNADAGMIDGFGFGEGFGSGNGSGAGFGNGLGGGGGAGAGMSAQVGKLTVKAQALGVVLDTSGSMQNDLPTVKREIRRAFRGAETVEVVGCHLRHIPLTEDEDQERRIKLRSEAKTVIEAMEMLVVDGRVDAIYWFCDLMDGENEAGLARLAELLRIQESRAGRSVRLYVRSLQREPSEELRSIIKRSGGEVQVDDRTAR